MSWYRMERGWMNHEAFKPEPHTDREAWLWLIEHAAWRPRRINVRTQVVHLSRGELFVSGRVLAQQWRWSEKRTRAFLNRLKSLKMLEDAGKSSGKKTTHLGTHLKLCNYEKYQDVGRTERRAQDAPETHSGRTDHGEPIENTAESSLLQRVPVVQGIQVTIGGADAPADHGVYGFVGRTIRLKSEDLSKWQETFHAVPDLLAELEAADAYYSDNPPKNGKWFFPVSNWLKKAHHAALTAKQTDRKAEDDAYRGIL